MCRWVDRWKWKMLPTHKNEKPTSSLKVLCFTFNNLSPKSEFLVCCCLVFVFYLIFGYFAELIFSFDGVSGWYITLVQFGFYAFFGLFENVGRERSVPIRIYFLLAFLTLGTMVRRCSRLDIDADVETFFFPPGPIKLLTRISQLPDANHLQKLQAHSRSDRIDFNPEEETQCDGLHSRVCHVHWAYFFHARRLESLAKVLELRRVHHFARACVRCCDWKRSGVGDEEA